MMESATISEYLPSPLLKARTSGQSTHRLVQPVNLWYCENRSHSWCQSSCWSACGSCGAGLLGSTPVATLVVHLLGRLSILAMRSIPSNGFTVFKLIYEFCCEEAYKCIVYYMTSMIGQIISKLRFLILSFLQCLVLILISRL